MSQPLHISLVYGSTRSGRLCDRVADWTAARIQEHREFRLQIVDPAQPTSAQEDTPDDLQKPLQQADAMIVVTPEYNHSFPAPLKALLDSTGSAWRAKPVAFVSYGGISGGLRAVEQLRLVISELHAVSIRKSISFADVWHHFDEQGRLDRAEPAHDAMNAMLAQLGWWARALRDARQAIPYDPVA